jgi:hypothetical protein
LIHHLPARVHARAGIHLPLAWPPRRTSGTVEQLVGNLSGHRSAGEVRPPFRGSESDDEVARFYAERTLTKAPVTPADQADAFFLLLSNRLSKTTGQVITVDGGLHEAFLR